jgi:transcriptional regulator with XRE-family HTH domain
MKVHDLDKIIGINLAKLRSERRLTQEQLAELISVHPKTVHKWERGTKGIGKNVLMDLCGYFRVEPIEFFIDGKTPLLKNPLERKLLRMIRKADELGGAYLIEHYTDYTIRRLQREAADRDKTGNS